MTGRVERRILAIAACAVTALALAPVAANAGTQCKSARVSIGSITESQAISAWSSKVRKSYGSAWSDFNLARNKSATQQNLGVTTLYFITASPCRRT